MKIRMIVNDDEKHNDSQRISLALHGVGDATQWVQVASPNLWQVDLSHH